MRKNLILASCAMCVAVTTPAFASNKDVKLGKGDYILAVLPVDKLAALYPEKTPVVDPVNQRDFDATQIIDGECRTVVKKQSPSMLKDVGLTVLRTAPEIALGTALGASLGNFTPARSVIRPKDYGVYGGVAGAGGAVGGAINAHEMGKHTAVASCMTAMLAKAQRKGYVNDNVVIFYSPFPTRGHPVKRSEFPAVTANNAVTPETRAKAIKNDGAEVAPPPAPGN